MPRICTKVESPAWAWAGPNHAAIISWFFYFHIDKVSVGFCLDFDCLLSQSVPPPGKKWSLISHISNIKLGWFIFDICGRFLFLLLNCLMMSVRKFSAPGFLCLIFSCNCFFLLCFWSGSVSLPPIVTCSEVSAFSNSAILFLMASTVCFCFLFSDCNSCMSISRTCMHCETLCMHSPVLGFDKGLMCDDLLYLHLNFIVCCHLISQNYSNKCVLPEMLWTNYFHLCYALFHMQECYPDFLWCISNYAMQDIAMYPNLMWKCELATSEKTVNLRYHVWVTWL